MSFFERVAEAKIRQGIEQGEFDELAGAGKPLDLDDMRGVRAEDRAAYTLLRNSGFAPEEVGTRRELADVEARMERALSSGADVEGAELETLRRRRVALELKRDLARDKRLGRL